MFKFDLARHFLRRSTERRRKCRGDAIPATKKSPFMETNVSQAPRRRRRIRGHPQHHQAWAGWRTLDKALAGLLARPRVVQTLTALIGIALLLVTLRPLLWG